MFKLFINKLENLALFSRCLQLGSGGVCNNRIYSECIYMEIFTEILSVAREM